LHSSLTAATAAPRAGRASNHPVTSAPPREVARHAMTTPDQQEQRFRDIFHAAHHDHAGCAADEWLMEPCRDADGRPGDRPLVWSRRNGPWRRVPLLFVGAAPGNAGGLGSSELGA